MPPTSRLPWLSYLLSVLPPTSHRLSWPSTATSMGRKPKGKVPSRLPWLDSLVRLLLSRLATQALPWPSTATDSGLIPTGKWPTRAGGALTTAAGALVGEA